MNHAATIPTVEGVRWRYARRWKATVQYERPAAVPVTFHDTAVERLVALREAVAALEASIVSTVRASVPVWPAAWPTGLNASLFDSLRDKMASRGFQEDSLDWVARDRATARLLTRLRTQRARQRALGASPIVTLRLPVGQYYGRPVDSSDTAVDLGVDLGLGDCTPPANVAGCAYAETALIEGRWWLRFVFVTSGTDRAAAATATEIAAADGDDDE